MDLIKSNGTEIPWNTIRKIGYDMIIIELGADKRWPLYILLHIFLIRIYVFLYAKTLFTFYIKSYNY